MYRHLEEGVVDVLSRCKISHCPIDFANLYHRGELATFRSWRAGSLEGGGGGGVRYTRLRLTSLNIHSSCYGA